MALRNITLYGTLRDKFGKEHRVDANKLSHVLSGLQSQHKLMRKYLLKGMHWQILVNNKPVTAKQLDDNLSETDTDIKIVPVIAGAFDPITWAYIIIAALVVAVAVLYSDMPQTDNAGNSNSYMFNGALNTVEQGGPVPLVYGRTRVGSVVISSGITNGEYGTYTSGGGIGRGGGTNKYYLK